VHLEKVGGIEIRAWGVLPTEIQAGGRELVAPVLAVRGPVRELVARTGNAEAKYDGPMRLLGESERLVAVVGGDYAMAKELFAPRVVVAVGLNADDPLPGSGVAWGVLDGLVIDSTALGRVARGTIEELLTGGTTVAVKGENRPGWLAVWERKGLYWIGHREIAGPHGSIVNEATYGPTYGWEPGWSARVRGQVMILAGVIAGAMLLVALVLRGRRLIVGEIVVALCAGGAEYAFARAHPALFDASGSVVVRQGESLQVDRWNYQACVKGTEAAIRWDRLTWPMWASGTQIETAGMTLRCDEQGRPMGFVYHLPDRGRIGFLSRRFEAAHALNGNGGDSAMQGVARSFYVDDHTSIVGQSADQQQWGQVVLEQRATTPSLQ